MGAVRFSLGRETTAEEIDAVLSRLVDLWRILRAGADAPPQDEVGD
jgi:cysteine sulfinate desulfinase/cysteine desulfurase-like protein